MRGIPQHYCRKKGGLPKKNLNDIAFELILDTAKTVTLEKLAEDYQRREKEYLDWCECTYMEMYDDFEYAEECYENDCLRTALIVAIHPEILKIDIDALELNNDDIYEYGYWHPVKETETHGWDEYELQYEWEHYDYLSGFFIFTTTHERR